MLKRDKDSSSKMLAFKVDKPDNTSMIEEIKKLVISLYSYILFKKKN